MDITNKLLEERGFDPKEFRSRLRAIAEEKIEMKKHYAITDQELEAELWRSEARIASERYRQAEAESSK